MDREISGNIHTVVVAEQKNREHQLHVPSETRDDESIFLRLMDVLVEASHREEARGSSSAMSTKSGERSAAEEVSRCCVFFMFGGAGKR